MVKLKVNRFINDPNLCAVASSAIVANYYDNSIDYDRTKEIAVKKISKNVFDLGLDSAEIGMLLNRLGFNEVEIISSNLDFLDYSWAKLSKNKLIKKLNTLENKTKDETVQSYCKISSDFLKFSIKNKLIIDYTFSDYIREYLDKKIPVIITFNWTKYFRFTKDGVNGTPDPFLGDSTEHAVVAYGYDDKDVYICDPHVKFYKYKLKKYRDGFYKMPWEILMGVMGNGDVIIPSNFEK